MLLLLLVLLRGLYQAYPKLNLQLNTCMKRFSISLIVVLMAFELQTLAQAPVISGELRKWHKVTLTFDGPATSETATPNPFTNFRLNVTFTHNSGSPTYVVPGYWAATLPTPRRPMGINGAFTLPRTKQVRGITRHPSVPGTISPRTRLRRQGPRRVL